jgi:HAD superfamily hydrolase (TIGR01509 family)
MAQALLCELEGVVVDSAPLRRRALSEILAADGVDPCVQSHDVRSGMPELARIRASIAAAGCAADESRADLLLIAARRRFAELASGGISLQPGVREFLMDARARVPLALVTRASRAEADVLLSLSGLADLFDVRVAAEDTSRAKPDAAPYLRALDRLARRGAMAAERCIALEDGPVGAMSARAARIPCFLVGSVAAHDALKADAGISSLVGEGLDSLTALLERRMPMGGAPV